MNKWLNKINDATSTAKKMVTTAKKSSYDIVIEYLRDVILDIIALLGVVSPNEIYTHLLQFGYEMLPTPIRMIIPKDIFIDVVKNNTDKIIELIKSVQNSSKPMENEKV